MKGLTTWKTVAGKSAATIICLCIQHHYHRGTDLQLEETEPHGEAVQAEPTQTESAPQDTPSGTEQGGFFVSEDSDSTHMPTDTAVSSVTITDEEINDYLKTGSSFENGKFRIYSFFLHEHTTKEKIDFLKNEYGIGGKSPVFFNYHGNSGEKHDAKGVILQKGRISEPDVQVKLTWTNVAERLDRLIADGQYMSQQELDRIPSFERQRLGAGVIWFYNNLPQDEPRPIVFESGLHVSFWREADNIGDMLDNPEIISSIITSMRLVMENTPENDRDYDTRKIALDNLVAYE